MLLANRTAEKAQALANAIGAAVCDNTAAAGEADHLFLGVKPQMMAGMLAGIAPVLKARSSMGGLMSGFRRILFTTLFFHVLCLTGCAAHDDGGSPDIRISGTMENSFTWRK